MPASRTARSYAASPLGAEGPSPSPRSKSPFSPPPPPHFHPPPPPGTAGADRPPAFTPSPTAFHAPDSYLKKGPLANMSDAQIRRLHLGAGDPLTGEWWSLARAGRGIKPLGSLEKGKGAGGGKRKDGRRFDEAFDAYAAPVCEIFERMHQQSIHDAWAKRHNTASAEAKAAKRQRVEGARVIMEQQAASLAATMPLSVIGNRQSSATPPPPPPNGMGWDVRCEM